MQLSTTSKASYAGGRKNDYNRQKRCRRVSKRGGAFPARDMYRQESTRVDSKRLQLCPLPHLRL
eukprot:4731502-Amphidinium_carterae.2